MDAERLKDSPSGRLARAGQGKTAYSAGSASVGRWIPERSAGGRETPCRRMPAASGSADGYQFDVGSEVELICERIRRLYVLVHDAQQEGATLPEQAKDDAFALSYYYSELQGMKDVPPQHAAWHAGMLTALDDANTAAAKIQESFDRKTELDFEYMLQLLDAPDCSALTSEAKAILSEQ
jgi:hypothetical protein